MSDPQAPPGRPTTGIREGVHCFTTDAAWIEGRALEQLEAVATRRGVTAVAGMPDLHPGKYGPVGCAVLSDSVHPELAGSDIGCGMGLFAVDLPVHKLRIDRAAEDLAELEAPWTGKIEDALEANELPVTPF